MVTDGTPAGSGQVQVDGITWHGRQIAKHARLIPLQRRAASLPISLATTWQGQCTSICDR
jgi:hypothetical protein